MVLLGTPAVAATDGAMGSTPQIVVRCYPQTDLSPRDLELMRDVVIGAFEDTIDVADVVRRRAEIDRRIRNAD